MCDNWDWGGAKRKRNVTSKYLLCLSSIIHEEYLHSRFFRLLSQRFYSGWEFSKPHCLNLLMVRRFLTFLFPTLSWLWSYLYCSSFTSRLLRRFSVLLIMAIFLHTKYHRVTMNCDHLLCQSGVEWYMSPLNIPSWWLQILCCINIEINFFYNTHCTKLHICIVF